MWNHSVFSRNLGRLIEHDAVTENAAPALPSYLGHVLTDNQHGLVVDMQASTADGTAARSVAAEMLADVAGPVRRVTVGADREYDTKGFGLSGEIYGCMNSPDRIAMAKRAVMGGKSTAR